MSRLIAVLCAVAVALFAAPSLAADDAAAVLAQAMEGSKVPAMGVVVIRGGRVADQAVRGVKRNDRPDPVLIGDVWHLGSDAKPMTATLIVRLVERGVLSWDAPLSKLLPEIAGTMRPEYRSLTLVELLTHRSGFAHDTRDMAFFNTFYADKRPMARQRLAYVARVLTEAPEVAPRTTFSYSNTNFILAAVIAERATGRSYETLMRREVFGPLGATSAGFGVTHAGQTMGHHAGKPLSNSMASNPAMFAPAGNVFMTLGDWTRFCQDQLAGSHGGGKLLTPAGYHMMQTRLPGATSGLAWGVQDTIAGRKGPALTHAGSDGNWYAIVALFPETGNGILVTANAGEDMEGDKATKAVFSAFMPSLAPPR